MGAMELLTTVARKAGVDVLRADYYSPIPHGLTPDHFERRSPMRGIDWDTDRQFEWLAEVLDSTGGAPETIASRMFSPADQRILDAVIRHTKPSLVIELGSGTSTQVIARAHEDDLRVYDPYPNDRVEDAAEVVRLSAADVPLSDFEALQAGDVLFVDTSHTVKAGSEVNRIVLDVLPTLAPGVIVHFHDIFLPWDYPAAWLTKMRLYWNEQYLLQAFLSGNADWEVLAGAHGLWRTDAARFEGLVGSGVAGSFWMQKGSV
jgi:hypothetical protein